MQTVADVMTSNPRTLSTEDTLLDAARLMRDDGIGDVIVVRDGELAGIVTDRDIIVRAIAEGRIPEATKVEDVASRELVTIAPEEPGSGGSSDA